MQPTALSESTSTSFITPKLVQKKKKSIQRNLKNKM